MFFDDIKLQKRNDVFFKAPPPVPDTGWVRPLSFPDLTCASIIAFDCETYEPDFEHGPGWARGNGAIVGVSVAAIYANGFRGKWYFPVAHSVEAHDNFDRETVFAWLRVQLGTPHIPKCGANMLYDIGWLSEYNIEVLGSLYDVQFAEALLCDGEVNLDCLAAKYVGVTKTTDALYSWLHAAYGGPTGGKQRGNIWRSPPRLAGPYAEDDADLCLSVLAAQWPLLEARGVADLFRLECDLIPMWVEMRREGQSVDLVAAELGHTALSKLIIEREAELACISGLQINVASGPDLERLFVKLNLPTVRSKATGKISFRKDWLKNQDHPVALLVNEIREYYKLRDTFIQAYILEGNFKGKIHASFNAMRSDEGGAITGRIACVHGSTILNTSRGSFRIDKYFPIKGDLIQAHTGDWQPILRKIYKGRAGMFRVVLDNGSVLVCALEHKVLTPAGWQSLGSLCVGSVVYSYEYKQRMDDSKKHSSSDILLYSSREANNRPNSRIFQADIPHNTTHSEEQLIYRTIHSGKGTSILSFKNGRAKPDVWKEWRATPQLHRGLRGRLRLSNKATYRRKKILCAQNHFCSSIGNRAKSVTGNYAHSSYKYKHTRQSIRQSYALHAGRTQSASRSTHRITEIAALGAMGVYDLEVANDHSYIAQGFYNHNCSNPNLQNIPTRSKTLVEGIRLGKLLRRMFIPDEGHYAIGKGDYSQIEYRFHVHFAVGQGSAGVKQAFIDNPDTDYHNLVHDLVLEQTGQDIERPFIKNINFGLLYSMSEAKLGRMLGLTPEATKTLFNAYHTANPYTKTTMQYFMSETQRLGYVETILGRKTNFDLWEPKNVDYQNRATALPLDKALIQYGSAIQRAYLHKAINYKYQGSAADQMKAGMLALWKSGVLKYTGVPRMTVHDELDFSVRDNSAATQEAFAFIKHTMETVIQLSLPIKFDFSTGKTWGDC